MQATPMPFATPVKEIALTLLPTYSAQLADKVAQSGFSPDHVLFVERGGLLIGVEIAAYFGCVVSGISATRSGRTSKAALKSLLCYLPRSIANLLRRIEIYSGIHRLNSNRAVSVEGELPGRDKKILIVDDALDTGYSIRAIVDYLADKGYKSGLIKVAVITTTSATPVFPADYSLFEKVICRFPWSTDSREYQQARSQYELRRKQLCQIR